MSYTSHNILFRSLSDEEEAEFAAFARDNDPETLDGGPITAERFHIMHPVCRRMWIARGIEPCDAECTECGRDLCPHGDELHFHHDGCPSCTPGGRMTLPQPLPERFAGSISEGTLRTQDLLPRFEVILRQANPEHTICREYKAVWDAARVLAEATSVNAEDILEDVGYWDAEQTQYLLNDSLFDALNDVAPLGTYFGASEGDGASFGFWPLDDNEEEEED